MTVLVAVADDDLRERVVAVGIELGRAFEEPLYVVHLTADETADAEAREVRTEMDDRLADVGIDYDVAVEHAGFTRGRSGNATGKQLAEIASDVTISHIVVGHHTKRALRSFAEGSTAFAVAEAASVPVTVVPETHGER
jgi:nucleotide-binding universal stress UspA family protein